MDQSLTNSLALSTSSKHAAMADCYRALGAPGLALRERTMAVVIYDRALTHWSFRNQPAPTNHAHI